MPRDAAALEARIEVGPHFSLDKVAVFQQVGIYGTYASRGLSTK